MPLTAFLVQLSIGSECASLTARGSLTERGEGVRAGWVAQPSAIEA